MGSSLWFVLDTKGSVLHCVANWCSQFNSYADAHIGVIFPNNRKVPVDTDKEGARRCHTLPQTNALLSSPVMSSTACEIKADADENRLD